MENKRKLKVVVAHPQKQGSYLLSSSLFRSGFLNKYITSFYFKPFTIAHLIHFFSSKRNKERIENRKIKGLPSQKVKVVCQLSSLKAMYYNRKEKHVDFINANEKLNNKFGKTVSNYCKKNSIDVVFSSIKNSLALFKLNKKTTCINILELSSNTPQYALSIYKKDIALFPNSTLDDEIKDYYSGHDEEYKYADAFLCPSSITAKSLTFCGVNQKNIFIVNRCFINRNYTYTNHIFNNEHNKPLKIVYVGNITAMKGIHHLCNTVILLENEVELFLIGTYSLDFKKPYDNYKNIHFLGKKNQTEINVFFKECDLFVFPSLADAVGMSALEAMYSGLPVLCSIYAGATDYITDGVNGFVFDPMNEDDFKNKLKEIIHILSTNSGEISRLAHETICNSTQDLYDKKVRELILSLKK